MTNMTFKFLRTFDCELENFYVNKGLILFQSIYYLILLHVCLVFVGIRVPHPGCRAPGTTFCN